MARPKIKKRPKTLFGKRLHTLFGDSNFSYFEKKYGLSVGQISKFIDGVEPRLSAVMAIIKGTGCNAEWLLFGEGDQIKGTKMNGFIQINVDSRISMRLKQFFKAITSSPDWKSKCEQTGVNTDVIKSFLRHHETVPVQEDLIVFARLGGGLLWLLTGEGEMEGKSDRDEK